MTDLRQATGQRTDLGWLRHRSGRRPEPAPAARSSEPPAPVRTDALDLPGPGPTGGELDLSAPTTSSDLDLSATDTRLGPADVPQQAPRPALAGRPDRRAPSGTRTILTPQEPTVTLGRVQCGIGALTVEALCSPAVGDLRLGAVYQLADGFTGVLSRAAGIPVAPPRSRCPVLTGSWVESDQISVDLRQCRSIRRLIVYAFSESGQEITWGGTVVLTTFGGARVEIPLDVGRHAGTVVVLSIYVIDGEFVLRAELDRIDGRVRDVALTYGYQAISWADEQTPVL